MSGIKLKGDTTGEILLDVPAVAGTNTLTLPAETGTLATTTEVNNVYNSLGVRNLIINGDMNIAQRGTSFNVVGSDTKYTVDRFALGIIEGDFTATQDTDVPIGQGFASSVKIDNNSAIATLAAGTQNYFEQRIEAQNLVQLSYGTANAKTITLSFWVKSNKTGTYIFWLYSPDTNNMISNSYTIDTADTWEKKTITIVGDTVGGIANNNLIGFYVRFIIGAGSDYQASSLATSWTPITNATRYQGQVNLADSTANYINITGVQLEANTTATPFEHRPYDMELARCQRYYENIGFQSGFIPLGSGAGKNTTSVQAILPLKQIKRDNPTVSASIPASIVAYDSAARFASSVSFIAYGNNPTIRMDITSSSITIGHAYYVYIDNNASAGIEIDAEL